MIDHIFLFSKNDDANEKQQKNQASKMNDDFVGSSLEKIKNTSRFPNDAHADDDSHEKGDDGRDHNTVSFGFVNIHKHRMTLSNNPATRIGLPVEISWEEHSSELLNVDEYESTKQSHSSLHRLPASTRRKIAEQHHTRESIRRVEEDIKEAKKSIESSKLDHPALHCCIQ
jgi:hypothetical protein